MNQYTAEEIEQLVELVRELLRSNEELNAKIIAMDSLLRNEKAKTQSLKKWIIQYEERNRNNSTN